MSMTLSDSAGADYRNARYFAIACELAYLDEASARPPFLERLGLDARLVSNDNTQVYVGENDASIVVAFRGSESPATLDGIKDWLLTNADNFLIIPEGRIGTDFAAAGVGARFHKGFMSALADIWEPLYAAVDAAVKRKDRPLWVTGHSLGGALALLAAWRLQQQFLPVHQIYTFGAPMVGNKAAADAFEREFPDKIFRFVDSFDVVPKLPTVSLITNSYDHCLSEMLLEAKVAAASSASPAVEMMKSFAGKTVDGVLSATLIDELWGTLKARIQHHMMANYQERVEEKC